MLLTKGVAQKRILAGTTALVLVTGTIVTVGSFNSEPPVVAAQSQRPEEDRASRSGERTEISEMVTLAKEKRFSQEQVNLKREEERETIRKAKIEAERKRKAAEAARKELERRQAIAAAARKKERENRQKFSYPAASGGTSGAKSYALNVLGSTQFQCFNAIVVRESGWRHTATNPSSGAYGLMQALPGSKMASAGADWATNPITQVKWGISYMNGRYGSPCGAWSFWQANHWY